MSNKVYWFTGLSGSGKTTLATALFKNLLTDNAILLDGDVMREEDKNRDFTFAGRMDNVKKAIDVCLSEPQKSIVVSMISPTREMRALAREQLNNRFIEIFVQCSVEECVRRDTKGLYRKALIGEIKNFTGISQKYEEPLQPDYIINTERFTIEHCLRELLFLSKI